MRLREAYGIARSLAMYYGQPWRSGRRRRFYRQFISPGSLCFDVGAHVGNRVACWRQLGARVVAIEPQPELFRLLTALYGKDPKVVLHRIGLAAQPGTRTLHISTLTPTVSTLAPDWMDEVRQDDRFASIVWDERVSVAVETLDALISRHGEPAFCKVDVEGLELEVLEGLSRPVRALSFEYIPISRDRAFACINRLSALGPYLFRRSPVETMRWASPRWLTAALLKAELAALPVTAGSGDIYALASEP